MLLVRRYTQNLNLQPPVGLHADNTHCKREDSTLFCCIRKLNEAVDEISFFIRYHLKRDGEVRKLKALVWRTTQGQLVLQRRDG